MNRMLRNYFALLIVFLSANSILYSQTREVVIKGIVKDTNGRAVAFATVQNENNKTGTTTDINGKFIFRTSVPATLSATLIGYKGQRKVISNIDIADTIKLVFILQQEATQLGGVEIKAVHEPELVQEAGNLIDFELKNNQLWALYTVSKHSQIRVYDSTGIVKLNQLNLGFIAEGIAKTPHGYLFTIHQDSSYFYRLTDNKFHSFTMPTEKFLASVKNLVEYRNPYYYHIHKYNYHSAVSYWYHSRSDSASRVFYQYENGKMLADNEQNAEDIGELDKREATQQGMILSSSTVSWGPFINGKETGANDAHVTMNQAGDEKRAARDESYALPMLMQDVNTVLKVVRDSIYIFNFTNDSIDVYDGGNYYVRRMPLLFDEHDGSYKRRGIVVDEDKQCCYFGLESHGVTYLKKIDLNTGKSTYTQKLKFPYIEKVRVMNGCAYFSYDGPTGTLAYPKELAIYKQKLN